MRRHAYDPATGEFIQSFIGPESEIARLVGLGYAITEGPHVNRNNYNYIGGLLTAKIPVTIYPDKSNIDADGIDQAIVSVVVGGDPPASIDVLVGGESDTISLSNGVGTLDPITAVVAGNIEVRISDQVAYKDDGGCTITAE